MFEMKDEFLTGIELIDDEHRELFRIAQTAMDLYQDEYVADKYDHIIEILKELKAYAIKHFADEEAYMESIQYKRLFTQKIEHNAFVEKLNEFDLDKIDENQEGAILDLLNFLNDWLVNHILEKDKLISQ
ncbi:hemerythrin [Mobilisporobacter senegalensis]|uniref:Hemerythrin n=1 Tax=Mobilisporobacter senegalensis TaxID=1329262 RepID=A0A3N1XNT6_9FIRM|nr:hemerythrin family protein [Mobilisporobacter senegalensis]ROR26397.1 hemerythrin [Mobilisporobacter senegalensis]